jgi:hypothetical protein
MVRPLNRSRYLPGAAGIWENEPSSDSEGFIDFSQVSTVYLLCSVLFRNDKRRFFDGGGLSPSSSAPLICRTVIFGRVTRENQNDTLMK